MVELSQRTIFTFLPPFTKPMPATRCDPQRNGFGFVHGLGWDTHPAQVDRCTDSVGWHAPGPFRQIEGRNDIRLGNTIPCSRGGPMGRNESARFLQDRCRIARRSWAGRWNRAHGRNTAGDPCRQPGKCFRGGGLKRRTIGVRGGPVGNWRSTWTR